ncbi:DUF6221 family protein [Nocardia sp. NPDC019302]|uniref:DUF6221 family protein n=1 Tax=Nocardia sp. NPDC019302 TaxID=3154592 RepID=UPI0033DFD19D
MTDPLSRLTRGLSEDERIARACIDDSPHWMATPSGVDQIESDGGYEVATGYFTQTRRPLANQHIANFDPARVLRQVEKLRDAAALLDDALNGSGPEPDLRAVCTDLAELLAGIYEDEETL